jgi:hypothetical protein
LDGARNFETNGFGTGLHAETMTHCRFAFAMAPNSAEAERVFSLLKILYGSNKDTALSDYIRGPIILRYNNT